MPNLDSTTVFFSVVALIWLSMPLFGLYYLTGGQNGGLARWADRKCSALWLTLWRMPLPMTHDRFLAWVRRACQQPKNASEHVGIAWETAFGYAAVMRVRTDEFDPELWKMVPVYTSVVLNYQDRAFHLCCRMPCEQPLGFPQTDSVKDYHLNSSTYAVVEEQDGYSVIISRVLPDELLGGFRMRDWLFSTVSMGKEVRKAIVEFRKALSQGPLVPANVTC
jgi:hypothetical protein